MARKTIFDLYNEQNKPVAKRIIVDVEKGVVETEDDEPEVVEETTEETTEEKTDATDETETEEETKEETKESED